MKNNVYGNAYLGMPLSERQIEILKLMEAGQKNTTISQELGLSRRTVEGHRAKINGKLGAVNEINAVSIAIRRGLI